MDDQDKMMDALSYYATLALGGIGGAAMIRERPFVGALGGFLIPWLMLNRPPADKATNDSSSESTSQPTESRR